MAMTTMQMLRVSEQSAVAEARRAAAAMAKQTGFDETRCGAAALIATELATNLVKHGGGGELLVGSYDEAGEVGIELLALDKGRGIANIGEAMRDGYSSAGSAGQGLGAVKRQADLLDIVSWPGNGTAALARMTLNRRRGEAMPPSRWGVVQLAMQGEEVCGDSWDVAADETGLKLMVVDGLGHGPSAADAAAAAVRVFRKDPWLPATELLQRIHQALRPTRGAAVAIADLAAPDRVVFAGIGNVAGTVVNGAQMRRMISHNGTAGHAVHRIQAFEYPTGAAPLVVMHSDGLSSGWSFERYPGLTSAHPSLIAGVLYRDGSRGRDDVTVLVARGVA
jgi:anti-sigma regulatory factor (Ser/Thr protein kinase)